MKEFIGAGDSIGGRIASDGDSRRYGDPPGPAAGFSPPSLDGSLDGEMVAQETGSDETPVEAISAALERVFNGTVALILIILTLPVFCGVALLILVADGAPVLYLGRRLGRHKRPFTMIKFRTLQNGSSSALGGQIHSPNHRLEIPGGKFLRETRLDELPQLINILKGDMNLFGPRPEREEVYQSLCRHIDGYNRRFAVKPGLVGASQLFTPHGAPRRLRTFIDNRIQRKRSRLRELLYVGLAALTVARSIAAWMCLSFFEFIRIAARCRNKRRFRRRRPRRALVRIESAGNGRRPTDGDPVGSIEPVEIPVADINEEALCFHNPERLADPGSSLRFNMEVRFRRRFRPSAGRVRTASGAAEVVQVRQTASGWAHIVRYEAASEKGRYIILQYLLKDSLRPPFALRVWPFVKKYRI